MEDDKKDELTDYAEKYDRAFRLKERSRSLISRGSTPVVVDYQDGDGNWRSKIKMSRTKFNEREKGIFLEEYRKWGRMGEAASAAGVSTQTVRKAIDQDEDFAEALMVAEDEYRDKLIGHHQNLVFNGTERVSYGRDGSIVGTETIYPIRLIELELKKHDSGYRERQEVAINHSGGVLVAPAEMSSIDDWEKRFSSAKNITPPPLQIDAESSMSSSSDDEE